MPYINPYDLLVITPEKLSDVNGAAINKAKRKLFAEIELSDSSTIVYGGFEISKGECLRVIDELDNQQKKEFHFFIYQHRHLNQFLANGSLNFFENYQAESIYKHPEFLNFISPFFAEQYDRLLLENYKRENQIVVAKILSVKPITNEANFEKCYKSTYAYLKEIDTEINEIIKNIANNKSAFIGKKFSGLDRVIMNKVNVPLLNLLPSYFQSLRNQIALTIRNLARDINNDPFKLYEPAFKIIDIAYSIKIDALTKQTITKGYFTIKKNYEDDLKKLQEQKEAEAKNQMISYLDKKIAKIRLIKDEIEDGVSKYTVFEFSSLDKVVYEIANPQELNSLSSDYQYYRNQVANIIRSLAATLNNEPYHKHKVAYDLISIAYSINSNGDIAGNIASAYETIKRNYEKQVRNQQAATNSSLNNPSQQQTTTKTHEIEKVKKTSWKYKIFMSLFCGLMAWALFNPFIQKVILSLGLLFLCIQIYYLIEKPSNFKKKKPIDLLFFFLSTAACIGGFFYLPLALLYISYNLIVSGHQLALDILMNKQFRKEISFGYLIIAALVTVMILGSQESQHQTIASNSPKAKETQPNKINLPISYNQSTPSAVNSNTSESLSDNYTPPKPVYNFPHMENGDITGCSNIHSQYNKDLNNKLIISCGSNADIAVKLINYITDKSIRYVYIQKNTTYTIWNIPEGKYYLKIAYGSDWGVKAGETNCEGRFTSKAVFEKGNDILNYDLIYQGDGSYEVPSYSLKLNIVYRTNDDSKTFNTNNISENDFYYE